MLKTVTKKFLAFILVAAFAFSTLGMQAFAAGTETWYGAYKAEPTITVHNNNLTPVKTMGVSGTLHISASIKGRPDLEDFDASPVMLTVEIRDLNGNVLDRNYAYENSFMTSTNVSTYVHAGEQYQIFFDVSSTGSNPSGKYRYGDVTYSHEIY